MIISSVELKWVLLVLVVQRKQERGGNINDINVHWHVFERSFLSQPPTSNIFIVSLGA